MGSVQVIYLSPWDNKCKTIKSEILGLSRNYPTFKFYHVDVTKHAMLRSVFTDDELPTVILVHSGEVFLSLDKAPPIQRIQEGLEALQAASQ